MSPLHAALDEYLAMRRALGHKLRLAGRLLQQLRRVRRSEGATYITTDLALAWATQPAEAQPAQWAHRLGMVRRFARYCSAIDPRTIVPPPDLLPHRYHRPDALPLSRRGDHALARGRATQLPSATGLRPHTFATLFGLYAVTGMRCQRAAATRPRRRRLVNGVLTIRDTKFGKSRYVPLHPSTQRALQRYAARRDRLCRDPADAELLRLGPRNPPDRLERPMDVRQVVSPDRPARRRRLPRTTPA